MITYPSLTPRIQDFLPHHHFRFHHDLCLFCYFLQQCSWFLPGCALSYHSSTDVVLQIQPSESRPAIAVHSTVTLAYCGVTTMSDSLHFLYSYLQSLWRRGADCYRYIPVYIVCIAYTRDKLLHKNQWQHNTTQNKTLLFLPK